MIFLKRIEGNKGLALLGGDGEGCGNQKKDGGRDASHLEVLWLVRGVIVIKVVGS